MIAADLVTGGIATGAVAMIAGLVQVIRVWREGRGKDDETWVGLVEKSSAMLIERVERVEAEEARCREELADCRAELRKRRRNEDLLRTALMRAGIPVPRLE